MRNHSPFCPWSTQCPEPAKEVEVLKKRYCLLYSFFAFQSLTKYVRDISPLGTFVELIVNHKPCMYNCITLNYMYSIMPNKSQDN